MTKVHDVTLKAGLKLGGPLAWKNRPGYTFFQGPTETTLIRSGAQVALGMNPVPIVQGREWRRPRAKSTVGPKRRRNPDEPKPRSCGADFQPRAALSPCHQPRSALKIVQYHQQAKTRRNTRAKTV